MKNLLISMMTIVLAFLLSASTQSCSSYDSPLAGQNVNDITMEATESFYDVSLGNSDLSKIKAQSSEAWCTPSVSGKTIRVNVQANDTFEERKAVVTLTDSEDGTTLAFNVAQKQNNAIITDSPTYYLVNGEGEFMVLVQSNIDFEVVIPYTCDWLKVKKDNARTRGLKNTPVRFVVSPNPTEEQRYVIVNFNNYEFGISTSVKIYQLSTGNPFTS